MTTSKHHSLLVWSVMFILSASLTTFSWAYVHSLQDAGAERLFTMEKKEVRFLLSWQEVCVGSLHVKMESADENILHLNGELRISSHGREFPVELPIELRGALVFNALDQLSGTAIRVSAKPLFSLFLETRGARPIVGKISWSTNLEQEVAELYFPFQFQGPLRVVERGEKYHFLLEGGVPGFVNLRGEQQERPALLARFPLGIQEVSVAHAGTCEAPKAIPLEEAYKALLTLKGAGA